MAAVLPRPTTIATLFLCSAGLWLATEVKGKYPIHYNYVTKVSKDGDAKKYRAQTRVVGKMSDK